MKKLIITTILAYIVAILATNTTNAQSISSQVTTLKSSIDTGITNKNATNKVRAVTEGALIKNVVDLAKNVYDSLNLYVAVTTYPNLTASGDGITANFMFTVASGLTSCIVISKTTVATVRCASLSGTTLTVSLTDAPVAGVDNVQFTAWCK